LEGFRGVNKRIELNLDKKSAVIYGGNGAGKTSLLQSLEWGLYGNLPYMKGGEFEREDAIVNQFHPKRTAEVQLELESEGQSYKIIRKREERKNSSRASHLTLQADGEILHTGEAEKKIVETIGLNQEGFYSTVYMHQDAVKTLVSGSPEERSDVIDRLLGIHLLRDLSTAIPLSSISRRRRELEKLVGEIGYSNIQEKISEENDSITEFRTTLVNGGFDPEHFEASYLTGSLEELAKNLEEIAPNLGVKVPVQSQTGREAEEIKEYSSNLIRHLSEMEDKLNQDLKVSVGEGERVKGLKDRYLETLNNLASYDIDKFEDISTRKEQQETQIKGIEPQLQKNKEKKTVLEEKLSRLRRLEEEKKDLEKELETYGSSQDRESNIDEELPPGLNGTSFLVHENFLLRDLAVTWM